MTYDLILKGGRVIDPAQGLDQIADVAFAGGRVAAIDVNIAQFERCGRSRCQRAYCYARLYRPPYACLLGRHIARRRCNRRLARQSGVTTLIDAGSAGPGNFRGFLKHVIEPSEPRILAYLHVSFAGIFAFSKRIMVGESSDMRLMSPADALAIADANRDVIVGIKVRVGRHASGSSGVAPLDIALQVAEELGLPLMAHIDEPPPSYEEVLIRLRPGDVLTHCFRPFPNSPVTAHVDAAGAVLRVVLAVLAGYGISGNDAIDITRALRAALHGFVSLEVAGGFGMPQDIDHSYRRMLTGFDRALHTANLE